MKAFLVLPLVLLGLGFTAARAPQPLAPAEGVETYVIDGGHSSVVFQVEHFGLANFYGRFNDVSGSIVADHDDPTKSEVTVEIQAASIDTNSGGRDDHLKGPDFFDVEQFPVILFQSKRIRAEGEGEMALTGFLELHGVRKEIEASLTAVGTGPDAWGGYRAGWEARFTIQRSDFGMSYGVENGALGDDVQVIVALEAKRQDG